MKQKPNKVDYSKLVEPIITEDNVIVGYKNVDEKLSNLNDWKIKLYTLLNKHADEKHFYWTKLGIDLEELISSELQREREKQRFIKLKSLEVIRKQERKETLKEVERIIGLDEFRVGQVYFFKKQLLSKINSLK